MPEAARGLSAGPFPIRQVTHRSSHPRRYFSFLPLRLSSIKAFVSLDLSLIFWVLQQPTTMPHVESEAQPQAESSTDAPQSLPFPPVTYSHILNCSYHEWQPK